MSDRETGPGRQSVFEGVDDVPWETMQHAYGSAEAVPAELRRLASDDADEREEAMGFMWGAVHHQGDVYDSTVAALPFLVRAAVSAGFPDRAGIMGLVASVGAYVDGYAARETGDETHARIGARVREELLRGLSGYLAALGDPGADVRLAAADLLAWFHEERALILPALRSALAAETDPGTQIGLVGACARLGADGPGPESGTESGLEPGRAAASEDATLAWLAALAAGDPAAARDERGTDGPGTAPGPHVRLAALVQHAARRPGGPAPGTAATALELVDEVYAEHDDDGPEGGIPAPDNGKTLLEAVDVDADAEFAPDPDADAQREEPDDSDDSDAAELGPWVSELLGELHTTLADRVAERIVLASHELAAPQGQRRVGGARSALWLMRDFRGEYAPLVRLLGAQLARPEPHLRWMVNQSLNMIAELAAPGADALAACLAGAPREAEGSPVGQLNPSWVTVHGAHTAVGELLSTLARTRDLRAVPMLRWCLERPQLPDHLGETLSAAGPAAAELAEPLAARVAQAVAEGRRDRALGALAVALGSLGAAAPVAVPLLAAMLDGDGTKFSAAPALGAFGPAAREAVAPLTRMLDDEDRRTALLAATALARIAPDEALLRPVFERYLADANGQGNIQAAEGLGLLGRSDRALGRETREQVDAMLESSYGWDAYAAGLALWYTSDDADQAFAALSRAWTGMPYARPRIAQQAAVIGPPARALEGLMRAELESSRRFTRPAGSHSYSSADVTDDEDLLRKIRIALDAVAQG